MDPEFRLWGFPPAERLVANLYKEFNLTLETRDVNIVITNSQIRKLKLKESNLATVTEM